MRYKAKPANSSHRKANTRAGKTHRLNKVNPLRGGFRL